VHTYTVELRIDGEGLDPEQVTDDLGVAPSQARKKGAYRGQHSIWDTNTWSLEVTPAGQDSWSSLEDGLASLLDVIAPIRGKIQSYLQAPGNDVYIWCGHFTSSLSGGPTLSAALLKSLGDLGTSLRICSYHSEDGG